MAVLYAQNFRWLFWHIAMFFGNIDNDSIIDLDSIISIDNSIRTGSSSIDNSIIIDIMTTDKS